MAFNSFTANTKMESAKMNENFNNTVHKTDVQKISGKINIPPTGNVSSGAFDCDTYSWFRRTLNGTNSTLSVTNDDVDQCFVVEITSDGSSTYTWWSGIKWEDGTAPTGSGASSGDVMVYGFKVVSAGNYLGLILGEYLS